MYKPPVKQPTPEQIEFIKSNYAVKSVDEIVKHLGVSRSVYMRWRRELKLPFVSNYHKPKQEKPDYYFNWNTVIKTDFILNPTV